MSAWTSRPGFLDFELDSDDYSDDGADYYDDGFDGDDFQIGMDLLIDTLLN